MYKLIKKINKISPRQNIVYLMKELKHISSISIDRNDASTVRTLFLNAGKKLISIHKHDHSLFFYIPKDLKNGHDGIEEIRKNGDILQSIINDSKLDYIIVCSIDFSDAETIAFTEGIALGNYRFLKYKTKDLNLAEASLKSVSVMSKNISQEKINELNIIIDSVYKCRNLINEPVSFLNASQLALEISKMANTAGFNVEVLNKNKIAALKMGGIIAVNKGSIDPPTFSILEWKPKNYKNKKPYIFVGKGIVFDTGGINLKPGSYMDDMKSDMAGAAAVASAIYAIASAKMPLHVIGLIPATDNRPAANAYVPGDVISMFDGSSVEVLNTDAEGRLILADALAYAKKFMPELVIDLATLTGAASIAIGKYGIVAMAAKADNEIECLKDAGNKVFERIVEFPFWDDYAELIKSDVADIKNIGGRDAGAITAGKFLEKFTDYPWIHLDIAGPAFVDKRYSYRGTGATGVGVRLIFEFLKAKAK